MVTKIWLIEPWGPEQVAGSLTVTLIVPMAGFMLEELPQLARKNAVPKDRNVATNQNATFWFVATFLSLGTAFFLASCGSSSSMNPAMGTINVTVSDPATCSGPQGSI